MVKKNMKKKALIAASIAGLMAATNVAMMPQAQAAETEACYGINACKGNGACGGKNSSCAGTNACKGQGFVEVAKGSCLKIQGGKLQA